MLDGQASTETSATPTDGVVAAPVVDAAPVTALGAATEAAADPVADPAVDPAKAADPKPADPAAAVPETYELTAPEGVTLDEATIGEATPVFRELGLTNEQANKLMPIAKSFADRIAAQSGVMAQDQQAAESAKWLTDAKADPEIGGGKWDQSMVTAAKALDALGFTAGTPFRDFLLKSPMGNHPEMIRAFVKVGQAIGEDDTFTRGGAVAAKQDKASVLYPDDVPKGVKLMATIGNSFLNLIDLYKGAGGMMGQVGEVVEVLRQLNPIMDDAVTAEANMGTFHRHTIRTGLPSVAWGRLYQGIAQSKSTTQQVDDTTGFVEGLSTVDTRLLDISANPAAVRLSEGRSFLEAMAQEVSTGFFYHNTTTTPEKFKGLAARYGATGGGGAGNQIVNAGGSGSDNTSIWFVTWGDDYTTLIHPKGSMAGVSREDKGEQRTYDANNNPYYVKEELFRQHVGVAVRDWRFNARIANLDVSDVLAGTVDLYKLMRQAYYKLQGRRAAKMSGDVPAMGRTVIYMNRDMLAALDATGTNASNNALMLKPMELQGEEVMSYRGIPIRETDAIINAESVVS